MRYDANADELVTYHVKLHPEMTFDALGYVQEVNVTMDAKSEAHLRTTLESMFPVGWVVSRCTMERPVMKKFRVNAFSIHEPHTAPGVPGGWLSVES